MIQFDFDRCIPTLLGINQYKIYESRKSEIYERFLHDTMTGWTKEIEPAVIEQILSLQQEVKMHSDCLVVIGIGGSYLGSYAVSSLLSSYFDSSSFPVIYAGTTLSSQYLEDLFAYLEDRDFSINVISKSGSTMETVIFYRMIKEFMERKYSKEEMQKRIIITTNSKGGFLREEAEKNHYFSFDIPDDVGGRYSIMTAAHLFPLSFSIHILKFVEGYYQGREYQEQAYQYALCRRSLFELGKYVENFCVYEEKMIPFTEWLKQLFGESEGKDKRGIFPVATVHTRDLHSLGQFIQEGHPILFETFLKVEKSSSLCYQGRSLHDINNVVLDAVRQAHVSGGVFCNMITIPCLNEFYIGSLMYFFMLSAAFSAYLFDVDPFNQPGVEVYKREVREQLDL